MPDQQHLQPRPGLGRLIRPADPRNKRYPMRLLLDPLREQFFPRGLPPGTRHYRQPKALDQLRTGTCVGHGWRQWMTGAPIMTKTGPGPFELYRYFIGADPFPENDVEITLPDDQLQYGTTVLAGAEWLYKNGYCKNYLHAESMDDVRAWHLSGLGTLAIGVIWTDDMFETDSRGFIRPTGEVAGGHCVKTTGWSDTARDSKTGKLGVLYLINNWGPKWGLRGRMRLAEADAQKLLFDDPDAECIAAVEQKVTPLAA